MPAPKDLSLLQGNWTKNQLKNKEKAKASVTPSIKLEPPDSIKNNIFYAHIWKKTLKLYKGTELLNALDVDMLTRYCIEKHSIESMYELRDKKKNITALLDKSIDKLAQIIKDDSIKDEIGSENLGKILNIITTGMERFGVDTMLKIETRIEAKTKMLNQMALALYMTPRSRAGAIPEQPDKEPKDENGDMFE